MTNQNYTFGKLSFALPEELQDYIKNLRLSTQPGELIQGSDNHCLLEKLATASSENRQRLKGQSITGWTTKKNTAGEHGIAAILEDGRCVSFNMKKAVKHYIELQESEF